MGKEPATARSHPRSGRIPGIDEAGQPLGEDGFGDVEGALLLFAWSAASSPSVACRPVKKTGRRVAFAEGEVKDAHGRVVATATSTLLVFEIPAGYS